MKVASPRIFRSLEHTGGRDGFDTIVGAAVASYGSLRAPSERQARDFGRLVVPLWDKVSSDTRRAFAAALSKSPRVPREIVDCLLAEPIEVSAPFLMSTPIFSEAELKALALGPDRHIRKIFAERIRRSESKDPALESATQGLPLPALEKSVSKLHVEATAIADHKPSHLARPAEASAEDAQDEPVTTAPPLAPDHGPFASLGNDRPRGERATPASAPEPRPDRSAATIMRETLRRLVLPGRRSASSSAATPSMAELVGMAVRQNAADFYDGLGRMLGLNEDAVVAIAAEPTGDRLAIALKALNAASADAMTVLMMMKPSIGLDVEAFERMTRTYRALKPADCAALVDASAHRPRLSAPTLAPQYQDLSPLPRSEARPVFGRRRALPGDAGTGKRSA
ncbi:MAG: hypothetical protein H7Y08_01910 [Rhizobiaceae bacterium]|nr:hypothetical protein [Rhizobiaceae bacterium]